MITFNIADQLVDGEKSWLIVFCWSGEKAFKKNQVGYMPNDKANNKWSYATHSPIVIFGVQIWSVRVILHVMATAKCNYTNIVCQHLHLQAKHTAGPMINYNLYNSFFGVFIDRIKYFLRVNFNFIVINRDFLALDNNNEKKSFIWKK